MNRRTQRRQPIKSRVFRDSEYIAFVVLSVIYLSLSLYSRARARDRLESIRLDQEVFGTQTRSALTKAFAVSMSLRMIATMATFAGFPAARRASYFAFISGL